MRHDSSVGPILLRADHLQVVESDLPGVLELRPRVFRDARGFLLESYHQARFARAGITETFVQDNHSYSKAGTLRGLHYQLRHAQAKLCRVVEGKALDVAVDLRVGSPHFGKWTRVVLSADEQNQIYIPAGFGHGFLALTPVVQFLYKCSEYYDPEDEFGLVWNDPQLGIDWGNAQPMVSEKDRANPLLSNVPREHLPRYCE